MIPYGPNYRMAKLSSLVKSGSGVAGIGDMTYDCDSLPQMSQQVTLSHMMSHMIVTCRMVNTISYLCLVTLAI